MAHLDTPSARSGFGSSLPTTTALRAWLATVGRFSIDLARVLVPPAQDAESAYLADATDLADLERRLRHLERDGLWR